MKKPTINKTLTSAEIENLEAEGVVFDIHDGKRILGRAVNSGNSILFLEDGSEIIRAPDGKFLEEWPEGG